MERRRRPRAQKLRQRILSSDDSALPSTQPSPLSSAIAPHSARRTDCPPAAADHRRAVEDDRADENPAPTKYRLASRSSTVCPLRTTRRIFSSTPNTPPSSMGFPSTPTSSAFFPSST